MKRRDFLARCACGSCAALIGGAPAYALDLLEPSIPPGYKPTDPRLEGGLWMVMEEFEKDLKVSPQLVRDEEMVGYLRDMVCRLAGDYCPDVRVYLLRSPYFNAFMTPNGVMVINTGLLIRVQNEAQLAFVLGHEIGHYLRRHTLQNFKRTRDTASVLSFLAIGFAAAGQYGASSAAQYVGLASLYGFSRKMEEEADAYGAQLVAQAGYPPDQGAIMWGNLIQEEEASKYRKYKDPFFASHPNPENRAKNITERAAALEQIIVRPGPVDRFDEIMATRRRFIIEDDLNLRQYGQSEVVLNRLMQAGQRMGELEFFYGELCRMRQGPGDLENAMTRYTKALEHADAPVETHRSMGLMLLKGKHKAEAVEAFRKYLELAPGASDRAMIQMYMGGTT